MYKIGDNIVHLVHGVGVIKSIEERVFGTHSKASKFYVVEIQVYGTPKKVFVPIESAERRLMAVK